MTKLKLILCRHFETVTHAFVMTLLDYCTCLYVGVSHSAVSRLQLVQNGAAQLTHNTLPVWFRAYFKKYFIKLWLFEWTRTCLSVWPDPSLRFLSCTQLQLVVLKIKCRLRGIVPSLFAGPHLWNQLPLLIKQAPSLSVLNHFQRHALLNLLLCESFELEVYMR